MADLTRLERRSPAVAILTLDHPERRNALSIAMRDEISARLDSLAADPELAVLVITGSGTVFCSGFDLREFERAASDAEFATALWASSDRYHETVATFPLVTIAALNGPAIAGGFDLAALCDLRVAATTTMFSHPEHAFAEVVYGPLHDLVGGGLARELALTGRVVAAAEALDAHLVSAVVEPDDVVARALEMADEIAVAPAEIVRRMKAKILRRAGFTAGAGTLEL